MSQRLRRIGASAGLGVLQRFVQLASTLLVMPLLVQALGPAGFGLWGAAASLAWVSGLVDIGVGAALVSLIARATRGAATPVAGRYLGAALALGFAISALLLLLAAVAGACGVWQGERMVYLIALLGLALHVPLNTAGNVWLALQEAHWVAIWELVQTLLTTVALALATRWTQDVRVYVLIVYAAMLAANLGSLFHVLLRHRAVRPSRPQWAVLREVFGHGLGFFLMGVAANLSFMLDTVLAQQWLGPEAAAQMTIALRVCITAVGMLLVISQPLWPVFATAGHDQDRPLISRYLMRGSAVVVGLSALGSSLLLLWGPTLLQLWLGQNMGIDTAWIWAMAAWIVTQALVRVPSLVLNGLLLTRFQTGVFALATALGFGLKLVLVPDLGAAGLLWATSVLALVLVVPACLWRIRRWQLRGA